ncbi:hypothetical protein M9Y10_038964 [Tritrichomonas musculus]|uniref:Kelch motif family protein n=1 Tax=Tritrichomonas musculus TaxID=1915356 RepID=A0ABR2K9W7_9EUKA
MGNGQSHTSTAYLKAVGAPPMFPSKRSKQEYNRTNSSKNVVSLNRPTTKPPFSCTWSVHYATGHSPVSRCGQCQIYDEKTDSLVIAYGVNPAGKFLNDMWILDLKTLSWRYVNAKLHQPRMNAKAIKYKREMIIFGGSCGKTYFSDLHSVNIDTGVVTIFDSSAVSPRENVLLFVSETSLFVWSGFNDQISIEFDEFDFKARKWIVKQVERENGRRAASYVADPHGQYDYVFGSTRGHPVTRFDEENETFEVLKCGGTAPPPELTNAMLTIADNFMFVFGGEMPKSNFSYLYALDLKRYFWFPFYVLPDNATTVYEDGEISNQGIFKLPRQYSGAFAYSKRTRSLISTMGSLFLEPSPISVIYIGNALSILNHRSDMLEMLYYRPD